jgi:DNA-binding NarL/FixJ family response regulator
MQILVVDDEPVIREVLREALRLAGHRTAACESAEMAVCLLPYVDAVICDGLNGTCWSVVDAAVVAGKALCLYTGDDEIQHEAALVGIPCVAKPRGVGELLDALGGALVEAVR